MEAGRDKDKKDGPDRALVEMIGASDALIAELGGQAECLVLTVPGSLTYSAPEVSELPFCAVAGVTTSRVARGAGLAGRTTALSLRRAAERGDLVAGLGMFEQGFYNRLGFGTLGYSVHAHFDPAHLQVPHLTRAPLRLSSGEMAEIHSNRVRRVRGHGSVSLGAVEFTRAELMWEPANGSCFFLGFRDEVDGHLTHHLFGRAKGESGPYEISWLAYETGEQLMELLSVVKSLGDQVRLVSMMEPPQLQLQDLIDRPFRSQIATEGGKMEHHFATFAESQIRVLDLPACVAAMLSPVELEINLVVEDPVVEYLDRDGWRGIGGDYQLRLGPRCELEVGSAEAGLPTLRVGAGALSRMWIGSRPATSLALTDQLDAPAELLIALDEAFRPPPPPRYDWEF